MGQRAKGVEIRPNSIRLTFTLNGKLLRRTLKANGHPVLPTPANIAYAERLAIEIRDRIRVGLFELTQYFPGDAVDSSTPTTVRSQLSTWLNGLRIEESTKAGYKSAVTFWNSVACDDKGNLLGDLGLQSLLTSQIKRAIASRPNLSGKTINNYVSVLRDALELAVTDKLVQENPVAKIKRAKHQKDPPDPFSKDEGERIMTAFKERFYGHVANMTEFWMWTGLRTSEVFALRWTNVDRLNGCALIREANVRGVQKDRTKTNAARTIRLNSRAMSALERQFSLTGTDGQEVFFDPRYGTPWKDERAYRRSFWTPVLKATGVRYRRPYNMRHTYATAMLMAGMTPAFCARQLGHSVEMFLRTYSKWLDGEQNDLEMQRLEQTFSPELPQK